jgi:hypothetical protein
MATPRVGLDLDPLNLRGAGGELAASLDSRASHFSLVNEGTAATAQDEAVSSQHVILASMSADYTMLEICFNYSTQVWYAAVPVLTRPNGVLLAVPRVEDFETIRDQYYQARDYRIGTFMDFVVPFRMDNDVHAISRFSSCGYYVDLDVSFMAFVRPFSGPDSFTKEFESEDGSCEGWPRALELATAAVDWLQRAATTPETDGYQTAVEEFQKLSLSPALT